MLLLKTENVLSDYLLLLIYQLEIQPLALIECQGAFEPPTWIENLHFSYPLEFECRLELVLIYYSNLTHARIQLAFVCELCDCFSCPICMRSTSVRVHAKHTLSFSAHLDMKLSSFSEICASLDPHEILVFFAIVQL